MATLTQIIGVTLTKGKKIYCI